MRFRRIIPLLAALALAPVAHAADFPVTPATFATAMASPHCGDTLHLRTGAYPAISIYNRTCAAPIVLASDDPAGPAVFPSIVYVRSSGLVIDGATVDFQPDAKTVDWSAAVRIDTASNITLRNMKIVGHDAVAGVPADAPKLDASGAVIGFAVGYGVQFQAVQDVSLTNSTITGFHRQVVMGSVTRGLIDGNMLRDRRTTAIVGADLTDVTVSNNTVQGVRPWRIGQTPVGDHVDGMAFWSGPGQTHPNDNLKILGNRILQYGGPSILGVWFQGSASAPFTNLTVSGNLIAIANNQGIALWNVTGGSITNNDLVTVQVAGVEVAKQRPAILLLDAVSGVLATGNRVGAVTADRTGVNSVSGNVITSGAVFVGDGPVVGPTAPDPRDAQIVALAASLKAATDSAAAALDTIAKVRAAVAP
jgi:hypothetical protein